MNARGNVALIIATALIASVWLQASALEDRSFDSNSVRIRYVEQGRGPAVVLIHGYTGNGDRHWVNTGVFAGLTADHRAIAIDCRGHGKSGKPRDPAAYGAEMSRDVVDFSITSTSAARTSSDSRWARSSRDI